MNRTFNNIILFHSKVLDKDVNLSGAMVNAAIQVKAGKRGDHKLTFSSNFAGRNPILGGEERAAVWDELLAKSFEDLQAIAPMCKMPEARPSRSR